MKEIYEENLMARDFVDSCLAKPSVRERAMTVGLKALSAHELIMLILGSGTSKKNVCALASEVLREVGKASDVDIVERLTEIDGIGSAKAIAVAAALELGERRAGALGRKILRPSDVVPLVRHFALERREHFVAVLLSGGQVVQKVNVVAVGAGNHVFVAPRDILADAVAEHSGAVIVCHNHPSGSAVPSDADIDLTDRIQRAAEILGIRLLDHIIVTEDDYYSFCENDMLCESGALPLEH